MITDKIEFNLEEQFLILNQLIKNVLKQAGQNQVPVLLVTDCLRKLQENNQQENNSDIDKKQKIRLMRAVAKINLMLVMLEEQKSVTEFLDHLKLQGLYRIIYHNPILKGQTIFDDDILNVLLRRGFQGMGISALSIALFVTTNLLNAPSWIMPISTGFFVGSVTYLAGISYGVTNDLFATHSNLPYFLLGHQPQQVSFLKTNDPVVHGVAWGIAATFAPVVIASIVFTITISIMAAFVRVPTFILPLLITAMPLVAIAAELYARRRAMGYEKNGMPGFGIGSNSYQSDGLRFMSPTNAEKAAWFANSDRNMFGFTKVPFVGLAALITMITLGLVEDKRSTILMNSTFWSVAVPTGFSSAVLLALVIAGTYMHMNRDKQTDNRFKLDFTKGNYKGLYLEEDMENALTLLAQYRHENPLTSSTTEQPPTNELNIVTQLISPPGTLKQTFFGTRSAEITSSFSVQRTMEV